MEIYIARQPIFARDGNPEAYELLYRGSGKNAYDPRVDGNLATRTVIGEALMNFGMDLLTGDKLAFVNFTQDLILDRTPFLLDPDRFVIEILEDVQMTSQVISCLEELKLRGYTLALDDYDCGALDERTLACIDLVKLDFLLTKPAQRAQCAKDLLAQGKRLLAEKVETEEDLEEARKIGCQLFQGYYFSKPTVLKKKRRDIATVTAVRLARLLTRNNVDVDELTDIIHLDAHLTYKLLKRIHTLKYYRGHKVTSVKHALVRMGLSETRRWVLLVLTQELTGGSSDELVRTALIRAVLCERIAEKAGLNISQMESFMVGMFSILDRNDPDFESLLNELELTDRIKNGLMDQQSLMGRILKVVQYYEQGDWKQVDAMVGLYGWDLGELYRFAVEYADEALEIDDGAASA